MYFCIPKVFNLQRMNSETIGSILKNFLPTESCGFCTNNLSVEFTKSFEVFMYFLDNQDHTNLPFYIIVCDLN